MIMVCTDRARWCGKCGLYLVAERPATPLFGRLLCLDCAKAIVTALEAEVATQAAAQAAVRQG